MYGAPELHCAIVLGKTAFQLAYICWPERFTTGRLVAFVPVMSALTVWVDVERNAIQVPPRPVAAACVAQRLLTFASPPRLPGDVVLNAASTMLFPQFALAVHAVFDIAVSQREQPLGSEAPFA